MKFIFPEYRLDWLGAGPSRPNKTGALLLIHFVVASWSAFRFCRGNWLSVLLALMKSAHLRMRLYSEVFGAL